MYLIPAAFTFILVSVTYEMPEQQNVLCRTMWQSLVSRNILLSDYPLVLVLQLKAKQKITNDMAKVQIKSDNSTPFSGLFHVKGLFSFRGS